MKVHYDSPPLAEVVCGIHFQYIANLMAPHCGLLWETFKTSGYERTAEAAPLVPASGVLELTHVPPLPRVWFMTADEQRIIQLQRDRFLFNWRRTGADEYPHFSSVFMAFLEHFKELQDFAAGLGVDEIQPLEYELTYINHIPLGGGLARVGEIFPDFCWRHQDRPPTELNWRTVVALPEERGRLLLSLRSSRRRDDDEPALVFELSAKGMHEDPDLLTSMQKWFEMSHDELIGMFTRMIAEEVQRDEWRKTDDG